MLHQAQASPDSAEHSWAEPVWSGGGVQNISSEKPCGEAVSVGLWGRELDAEGHDPVCCHGHE